MRGSITLPSYCSAENFKFIPLFCFPNQKIHKLFQIILKISFCSTAWATFSRLKMHWGEIKVVTNQCWKVGIFWGQLLSRCSLWQSVPKHIVEHWIMNNSLMIPSRHLSQRCSTVGIIVSFFVLLFSICNLNNAANEVNVHQCRNKRWMRDSHPEWIMMFSVDNGCDCTAWMLYYIMSKVKKKSLPKKISDSSYFPSIISKDMMFIVSNLGIIGFGWI